MIDVLKGRGECCVCRSPDFEASGLCSWHLTTWLASPERMSALSRPGAYQDDLIIDEALDSFIDRSKRERTWIQ